MTGSRWWAWHPLRHFIKTICKVGTLSSPFFIDGKLKFREVVQGFHGQEVVELHLPRTEAHVRNHCSALRFLLSHKVGAKYFSGKDMVTQDGARKCRALDGGLRSLGFTS